MVVTLVTLYIYIYISTFLQKNNGLKVTKKVTLFTVPNPKKYKKRLMLGF